MEENHSSALPKWPLRFLRWFCDPALIEDIEGDLHELYHERLLVTGKAPRTWLILQVLRLFRPGIIRPVFNMSKTQTNMVSHYFITAFRHAVRYRGHTLLNVFGLIIGISSAMLLMLYVDEEVSVDKFHDKSDRIVRLWRNMHQSTGAINTTPAIPQPLELVLENEIGQVDEVTLVSWDMEFPVRYEEYMAYYSGNYVSPEFFSIFSFTMLQGNNVFSNGASVVITDQLALAIFGEDWDSQALGETIMVNGNEAFTVTGVVEAPGTDSSIQFDLLLPAQTYIDRNDWVENWNNGGFRMYMTLNDPNDLAEVQALVENEVNKHIDNSADERIYLQPFRDNYLYGSFENGVPASGRIAYVRILGITAVFLLLIAAINYTNLTTARSTRRAREVGLRKVLGARTGTLRGQFFIESFLMVVVAIAISLGLVYLLLPYFSELAGRNLLLDWQAPMTWGFLGLLACSLTLLAGFYPAVVLPAFGIIASLKSRWVSGVGNAGFRKVLVVFQFALSMLLIIGMLVVSGQMEFILSKNLGVKKENRVTIPVENYSPETRILFREKARQHSDVASITLASANPLATGWSTSGAEWDGKDPDEVAEIHVLNVDQYFFETLGVSMAAGRGFSEEFASDSNNFVINEVAAELMGYDDPVGSNLSVWGTDGKIIGVVRNFHMSNLYDPIYPLIIRFAPEDTYVAIAHLNNAGSGLSFLKDLSLELNQDMPFRYTFMDQDFASDYESERSVSQLMKLFASLSVVIACLGLFGLISFTNEQRKKEIGIRKVMGASATALTFLLSREYLYLLIIAFLIASPAAYYLSWNWLDNFAFHVDVTLWVFVLAGLILMVVALLTTGVKSYLAALMNPVESIRSE